MMLLQKVACLRHFGTFWIGGFPKRQELLVSHDSLSPKARAARAKPKMAFGRFGVRCKVFRKYVVASVG